MQLDDLKDALEEYEYRCETDYESEHGYMGLYLRKKRADNQGWLSYYQTILEPAIYDLYVQNLGSETASGVLFIENGNNVYAAVHGQAHFVVRKYCDKDFGLDLAERIIDPVGLTMKHSQTFTSAGKKDITAYTSKRNLDDVCEYGEAFNYLKCKTTDKEKWGETVDFGESVRFTFGKDFFLRAEQLYMLADNIREQLLTAPVLHLPRYSKVTDRVIKEQLNNELNARFLEYLTGVATEEYWLTGVSFNFTGNYKYSLKFRSRELLPISNTLDEFTIKAVIDSESARIGGRYDLLKVLFYDEDENYQFTKPLQDLMQVTVERAGHYYVLFHNEWVEFSQSYVDYIIGQVDSVPFEIKDVGIKNETELIDDLVSTGAYIQLHKQNVYIGKYCIEKADLMDDENIISIKDQKQGANLVYLIKQATTSMRLSEAGDLGDNIFKGKNVCLWMLVNRKTLIRLSDFRSFHLLDAINDYRREAINHGLNPIIWISLK